MNKTIIIIIAVAIVVGGGAFYGGMKYSESKIPTGGLGRGAFQDLSSEQRQQLFQGNIEGGFQRGVMRGTGLSGEVIGKDKQSITLKMPDNGSKIVFFSDSTKISKTTDGSIEDIEIGKQIMVTGEQNPDGSYTAKTIQLSPHYPGQ